MLPGSLQSGASMAQGLEASPGLRMHPAKRARTDPESDGVLTPIWSVVGTSGRKSALTGDTADTVLPESSSASSACCESGFSAMERSFQAPPNREPDLLTVTVRWRGSAATSTDANAVAPSHEPTHAPLTHSALQLPRQLAFSPDLPRSTAVAAPPNLEAHKSLAVPRLPLTPLMLRRGKKFAVTYTTPSTPGTPPSPVATVDAAAPSGSDDSARVAPTPQPMTCADAVRSAAAAVSAPGAPAHGPVSSGPQVEGEGNGAGLLSAGVREVSFDDEDADDEASQPADLGRRRLFDLSPGNVFAVADKLGDEVVDNRGGTNADEEALTPIPMAKLSPPRYTEVAGRDYVPPPGQVRIRADPFVDDEATALQEALAQPQLTGSALERRALDEQVASVLALDDVEQVEPAADCEGFAGEDCMGPELDSYRARSAGARSARGGGMLGAPAAGGRIARRMAGLRPMRTHGNFGAGRVEMRPVWLDGGHLPRSSAWGHEVDPDLADYERARNARATAKGTNTPQEPSAGAWLPRIARPWFSQECL